MKLSGAPLPTSSTQNTASAAPATAHTGLGLSNRSRNSWADGIRTDASAPSAIGFKPDSAPEKPFAPSSDANIALAVAKVSARKTTQPKITNARVSNQP